MARLVVFLLLLCFSISLSDAKRLRTKRQCCGQCGTCNQPPTYINPCSMGLPIVSTTGYPQFCRWDVPSCPGNYFCHVGFNPTTTCCCQTTGGDPCQQPMSVGEGQAMLARFYYDPTTRSCQPFTYRGLRGNQNNFLTLASCQSTCQVPVWNNPCMAPVTQDQVPRCSLAHPICNMGSWCHYGADFDTTVCCPQAIPAADICSLPVSIGTGTAQLARWAYSPVTSACVNFVYSGLKGNQNNFLSRQDCERSCQAIVNACPMGNPLMSGSRLQVCSPVQSCPEGFWCHYGATPETTCCCQRTGDTCTLGSSVGSGTGMIQRWFFDGRSQSCQMFTYSGIKGNENNFLTRESCEASCRAQIPPNNPCPYGEPPLQQPFCSGTISCANTYWCHLGADEKTTVCCPGASNPCTQPFTQGDGTATIPRWRYDPVAQMCLSFTYRGMKGNQNNFLTRDLCESACRIFQNPCPTPLSGPPVMCNYGGNQCQGGSWCHLGEKAETTVCCPNVGSACTLMISEGEGNAQLPRFGFSPRTGRCEPFNYRGLRGNSNNFYTREDCRNQCREQSPCFGGAPPYESVGQIVQCSAINPNACPPTHFCHNGADTATTVCCPRLGNPCNQNSVIGTGTTKLTRWYYNSDQDDCVLFSYSGIGGNENNFLSKQDCDRTCPGYRGLCPHAKPLIVAGEPQSCSIETSCPTNYVCNVNTQLSTSVCCLDPVARGNCNDNVARYAYDPVSDTCKVFQWSGCAGNVNNFPNFETCTKLCCKQPPAVLSNSQQKTN